MGRFISAGLTAPAPAIVPLPLFSLPQRIARLYGALRGGVALEAEAVGCMGLSTSEVGDLIAGYAGE